MSATGRLTHRQIARRAGTTPRGLLDANGELNEAGEAYAEDLRDFDEAVLDAESFWRLEDTRFYAPMTDDGRVMA